MYRRAVSTDLPALAGLERALFGRHAWSQVALSAELARVPGDAYALVSEADTEVAGGADPNRSDAPTPVVAYALLRSNGETAEVLRIGVADGHRRRGLARQLLTVLLAEAEQRGCAEVLLEVAVSNLAAIRLYESVGFRELARRRGYYAAVDEHESGTDAAVMRRRLGSGQAAGTD